MRLDSFLFINHFVQSRNKANELIKSGFIKVDGKIVLKPSFIVDSDYKIEILKEVFVSRAGEKLDYYIKSHNLDFSNMNVLDIGSSKGGFTQVLLKYNAKSVTCVDIGRNQLDVSLRNNPKINLFESCDIREFNSLHLFDFIVCDVSFISIKNILDSIFRLLCGEALLLFKPQFEVGKNAKRNKKGVVMQKEAIDSALDEILALLKQYGFLILNVESSKLKGKEGNEEIFINIKKC
ncbi:TlyA family RNA methyltransferase [Helicobacter sp. MIT 99-5507]|uniref:23S rRNA (cytidine-2'-O)-methyltransferase TlyA n=1 Tax=Helicobacter sp. MIT 99-5507 TaxID=152489 RepID=UPI000E1E9B07|nr:TlyA family RNA methyltransferase [Helicobacter sp. MIT 99-5507]RDU57253.1 TlyA family rRNA (cytidine-2'-O)-methyltransferase [Helicobacter sp. MIT 99-5507]